MSRTLDAVEQLLRVRSFEDISVTDIVERASSSVGSFYAHFGNKEGLLPHLYERYDRNVHRRVERALASSEWQGMSLEEMATWMVSQAVRSFRRRRWLVRAMGWYARKHPDAITPAMQARRDELHREIASAFAGHHDRIGREDPARAVQLAIYFVNAICRDKILFPAPHARGTRISDAQLIEELTVLFLSYLGVEPE
ncbi:MAG: TetR/AcrR family transcriptional regulator [Phycisphaerae bacterium]